MSAKASKPTIDITHPEVAAQWHPTKNGDLKPGMTTFGSGKKVWWVCKKKHEWDATINKRTGGAGCPYCPTRGRRRVGYGNDLSTQNPKLAKEWHPTKNGTLTPRQILPDSNKKVWWLCKNNHEWLTSPNNRKGCSYCSGYKASDENNLEFLFPEVAKEWHPKKNDSLSPKEFTSGSSKKIWWICSRGHEWKTTIYHRTKSGTRCPLCFSQSSYLELQIFSELVSIFKECEHRALLFNQECDIFIRDISVGVEVDGVYWHRHKRRYDKDKSKNHNLKQKGIEVFRIREKGLRKIGKYDIVHNSNKDTFSSISKLLDQIIKTTELPKSTLRSIQKYQKGKILVNEKYFKTLWDRFPKPLPGKSFIELYPEPAREWYQKRNGTLTPYDVFPGAHKKVWWKCKKGHEWQAMVYNRSNGYGCPYCANKKVCDDNNLFVINHSLAKEWHPSKNNDLSAKNVTPISGKKVWWVCSKGHEWPAQIASRASGVGCPYCAHKLPTEEYNLAVLNKDVSSEWNTRKNGNLKPHHVLPRSHKKVWWLCKNGHEWKAVISNRAQGIGCPACSGKIATKEHNFAKLHPALVKEWHPSKNKGLKPSEFTPLSEKKVWWVCSKGHEWKTAFKKRSIGRGCHYCSGQKVSIENSLEKKSPNVAKTWNSKKNGDLFPKDVTNGSGKKVWWLCNKGHEWEAAIYSQVAGNGCPYCSNKKAGYGNDFGTKYPKLAKQWHPKKNGQLNPSNFLPGSGKTVWWLCSKGHEWRSIIKNRSSGHNCPHCWAVRRRSG